jgi:hypothetical protein
MISNRSIGTAPAATFWGTPAQRTGGDRTMTVAAQGARLVRAGQNRPAPAIVFINFIPAGLGPAGRIDCDPPHISVQPK